MKYTLCGYINAIDKGEITPDEVFAECFSTIQKENDSLNALITPTEEYAIQRVSDFSSLPLRGAPIAIKDNILAKGVRATCGSKILEDYIAPYSATAFKNLEKAGGVMIGRANMDEFAMGSSTENSAYGPTLNPVDPQRVPGGTSGGSAAAVASGMCVASLGTDTGGSVRQPAAFCGVVGAKPTYGRVSRYGIQPMGSSFDQLGVITQTVDDAALLLGVVSGYDPADSTSVQRPREEIESWLLENTGLEGVKIAMPKQFFSNGLDSRIADLVREQAVMLQKKGAIVEEVDVPLFDDVLPVYYTLMPAEVTTNLARFDGLRYGSQSETSGFDSLHDYYTHIRSTFLGPEVKRRILTGSYVLSSVNYEGFFLKAQKLRRLITSACDEIFNKYDAIIGPTTPKLPWKLGEKSHDPLAMYLEDIYTVTANIVGLPAMSVPCGFINEEGVNLPVGFHIMANHWREDMMFRIGREISSS